MGSASEVEYLFLLCRDLEYLDPERASALPTDVVRLRRMLWTLRQRLA